MIEVKSGSYKLDGLPLGEELDFYVTDSKNKEGDVLTIGDLRFVKERSFKADQSVLSGQLNGSGYVAVVRQLPVNQTEFDFTGRAVKTLDAKQNETLFMYDSLGRRTTVFQPAINHVRLATHQYYNESGNVIAQVIVPVDAETLEAKGEKRVTRIEHDPLGRAVKTIQPSPTGQGEDAVYRQEYDVRGNIVRNIDPLGNETQYDYDPLRRKISETNAEGGITKFTYDSAGRMKSLTDPVRNTTRWTHNLLGRIAGEHVVLNGVQHDRLFYYDASGNIITKLDRNGRITTWTFDQLNRPTSETWYADFNSWSQHKKSKQFVTTYNRSGKMSSVDDGDNKFMFTYGLFGNEIKQIQRLSGLNKPVEFNYTTDILGLKTDTVLKMNNVVDHTKRYEYDSLGRTTSLSQLSEAPTPQLVRITYNELGQLVKQSRFEGDQPVVETLNTYDRLGRITNISHQKGDKIFADYDMTWDIGNRITDFDFTYLNGPPKKKSRYEYDKTSQLIVAKYDFMPNESYHYDPNGNRLNAEIQGQKQSYQTGEFNRLLSDNENNYEYDAEGNRTSKTTKDGAATKYFWDNRNRLIKVQTPTETVEYIYDYQNRLVKRTENTVITNFVHDGWHIVRQLENGTPTHRYLWGTKQDELICDNNNWTLGDHLNTIRDIIKSDGNIVAHLEYNAYGNLLSKHKNTVNFAYTGKMTDIVTDLQWNINRWYDSKVGRWISEDPIGFEAKDMNLARYVHNATMTLVDADGQFAWIPFCIGVLEGVVAGTIVTVAAYIISNCNSCTSSSPPGFCSDPIDFCWNIIDGVLTTAPETGTITIPYGANCKRPCYSSSWFYCCTDKLGQYEGLGAYKCTKNSDNSLSLKFHMKTGVKTDCNASPCSTWPTCSAGSFIYYNPTED